MAAGSVKSSPPRAQRIAVSPKGEIFDGSVWIKALIQDVSDAGVALVCSREFRQGEILKLRLQLAPGNLIEFTVEIRHSNDMGTGAKIVSIDEKNRSAYDQYIQEFYSQHLGKLG
jgi:hypothetical protein